MTDTARTCSDVPRPPLVRQARVRAARGAPAGRPGSADAPRAARPAPGAETGGSARRTATHDPTAPEALPMWMLLKKALLALFLGRTFGGVLAILIAVLAPLAGILKIIGLPILIVMLVVAAPALFVLAVIGLPIALIAIAGFVLMGVLSGVLTL